MVDWCAHGGAAAAYPLSIIEDLCIAYWSIDETEAEGGRDLLLPGSLRITRDGCGDR